RGRLPFTAPVSQWGDGRRGRCRGAGGERILGHAWDHHAVCLARDPARMRRPSRASGGDRAARRSFGGGCVVKDYPIIDADGHVTESEAGLQAYLQPEYRSRPLIDTENWDRSFGGELGKNNEDPHVQLADMDAEGIDVQVIYPTRGLELPRV